MEPWQIQESYMIGIVKGSLFSISQNIVAIFFYFMHLYE
jgi:hypothetical protein